VRACAVFAMLLVAATHPVSAATRVQASYVTVTGRTVTREWRIEEKGTQALFYLEGKLRATAFLKDGVIVRLVLKKRHAGTWKNMIITSPAAIRQELQNGFYPFSVLLPRSATKRQWQTGSTRFVRMPEDAAE